MSPILHHRHLPPLPCRFLRSGHRRRTDTPRRPSFCPGLNWKKDPGSGRSSLEKRKTADAGSGSTASPSCPRPATTFVAIFGNVQEEARNTRERASALPGGRRLAERTPVGRSSRGRREQYLPSAELGSPAIHSGGYRSPPVGLNRRKKRGMRAASTKVFFLSTPCRTATYNVVYFQIPLYLGSNRRLLSCVRGRGRKERGGKEKPRESSGGKRRRGRKRTFIYGGKARGGKQNNCVIELYFIVSAALMLSVVIYFQEDFLREKTQFLYSVRTPLM